MQSLIKNKLYFLLLVGLIVSSAICKLSSAQERHENLGTLAGIVRDQDSGQPQPHVSIELIEIHRGTVSDASGHFIFDAVPVGPIGVRLSHIGYMTIVTEVEIPVSDTAYLETNLTPAPLSLPGLTVTAESDSDSRLSNQREIELKGVRLWQNIGMTVAKTLEHEPGIARRSMGPAPARPVLRGLDGSRLLVLEDGQQTGDLSATSPDHAVAIDPIGSSGVSVIRGPTGFLYGSNVLGGVVDVKKNSIPEILPETIYGTVMLQGESVNNGGVASMQMHIPLGPFATRFSTSGRTSDNISTPAGELGNTNIDGSEGSAGATMFYRDGYAGVSGSWYDSRYGIPGGFLGGHPNGVTIELERQHFEATLHHDFHHQIFRGLELRYNFNRYFHEEIESNGACGVSFGVLTYNAQIKMAMGSPDDRTHATFGLWSEYRDYAQGCLSFVPPTIERAVAGFMHGLTNLDRFTFEGAIRYDYREIDPRLGVDVPDSTKAGKVIPREFKGISGGLSARYDLSYRWDLVGSIMATRSLPNTEIIYADGPHLAAYSYEVGNTAIAAEKAIGVEISLESSNGNRTRYFASAFYYRFQDYIFPRNTGQLEFGPGEEGFLVRYQFDGQDVRFIGGELLWESILFGLVRFGGAASYASADLLDDDKPVPFIPPLNGKLWMQIKTGNASHLTLTARGALKQNRTDEFEEPTDGYLVIDVSEQRQWFRFGLAHSLILGVENIFDTEYREHLSRVKSVMPEPGLNVKLLYRVSF